MGLGLKISQFPLSEWRARAQTLLMLFSLDVKFLVYYPTFQAKRKQMQFMWDFGSIIWVPMSMSRRGSRWSGRWLKPSRQLAYRNSFWTSQKFVLDVSLLDEGLDQECKEISLGNNQLSEGFFGYKYSLILSINVGLLSSSGDPHGVSWQNLWVLWQIFTVIWLPLYGGLGRPTAFRRSSFLVWPPVTR